jgi:hypothetical protein
MTISTPIIIAAVGAIFVFGGFQALTLWRLLRIEKMLGNGVPGVFPRRDEVRVMIADHAEECHDRPH